MAELIPGDRVAAFGMSADFVARSPHPIWPQLQLVVWKMQDGTWSHDALDARQDVGEVEPSTSAERQWRLRQALLGSANR